MRQTITQSQFHDAFNNMGRADQFSYQAKNALFEYLEENMPDYDLDVIALCCEFTEATLDEVKESYTDIESFEELADSTTVIPVNSDTVIYAQF